MPFVAVIVGAILIIVAINNSHGQLATELEQDIPGFFKWAVAVVAILALGYVPGFRTPSRWLLALVALVVIVTNYKQVLSGLTSFTGSSGAASGSAAPNPSAAYASNPATTQTPTSTEIAGSGGSGSSTASAATNPLALVSSLLSPSIGFGGLA